MFLFSVKYWKVLCYVSVYFRFYFEIRATAVSIFYFCFLLTNKFHLLLIPDAFHLCLVSPDYVIYHALTCACFCCCCCVCLFFINETADWNLIPCFDLFSFRHGSTCSVHYKYNLNELSTLI